MIDLRQARLLRSLQQEIGTLDGEPIADRLRRWREVRSPDISTAQVAHRPQWAEAFAAESRRILAALGRDDVRIHHLGSTSIPGMRSKPILDLAIAVPERDAAQARAAVAGVLSSQGYADWGESPMAPGTRWYWRLEGDGQAERADQTLDGSEQDGPEQDGLERDGLEQDDRAGDAHATHRVAHVCTAGEVWLTSALDFRDYLRAHPERRVAYETLKRELSREADAGLAVYTLRKALLMYTIIRDARAWREEAAVGA